MAGRTKRAKGRTKESLGALTDNKELKDKGRVDQAAGTAEKKIRGARNRAGNAARKLRRKVD